MHHIFHCIRLTNHVQAPESSVSVTSIEGLEAVTQVPLTSDLSKFTGQILLDKGEKKKVITIDVWTIWPTYDCFYPRMLLYLSNTIRPLVYSFKEDQWHLQKIQMSEVIFASCLRLIFFLPFINSNIKHQINEQIDIQTQN